MTTPTQDELEQRMAEIKARRANGNRTPKNDRDVQSDGINARSATSGHEYDDRSIDKENGINRPTSNDVSNTVGGSGTQSARRYSEHTPEGDAISNTDAESRPEGLVFDGVSTLPNIPPFPIKRTKDAAVPVANTPPSVGKPNTVSSVLSGIRNKLPSPKVARQPDAVLPSKPTKPEKALTVSEADEYAENVADMIGGIAEFADALREAWIFPGQEDIAPLFTLDDDELAEGTDWLIRRGRKNPKMAQRVRVASDVYDSYATPISILFPRIKQFVGEVREHGIHPRGR